MSTERNVTVIFSGVNPLPTSTGIERDSIKNMKIGDRIKAYCVPVGEGDNKSDPYITFDINDALDHIEKYYGKKFGTTITVTCSTDYGYFDNRNYNAANTYDEGATSYTASIGFYAYKVDKGLLMANIWYGSTTIRILNRSNLYSGDGWRLLGPREISKYVLSDLNGTINPKINPWGLPGNYDARGTSIHYSFYQMPHNGSHCFIFGDSSIVFGGGYYNYMNYERGIGWPFIDVPNGMHDNQYTSFTGLFLYQYVESENATNIYY